MREQLASFRNVLDAQALAVAEENDLVLAYIRAASDAVNAYLVFRAFFGTLRSVVSMRALAYYLFNGRRYHQRGAGRRVQLRSVVRFYYFYIKTVKHACRARRKTAEHVYGDGHIAGFEYGYLLRRRFYFFKLLFGMPRSAQNHGKIVFYCVF